MSIMRIVRAFGLAAALLVGGTAAASAVEAHATAQLNVRAGPGTGHHVVDVLHRGQRVVIEFCQGTWCRITKPGPNGWVSANYLSRTDYPRDDYYYDDDYYDDFYIERPRRVRPYPVYPPRYYRPRSGVDFSACIGGPNARFCVYD
jgi:uncharacterized protein YraI